MTVFLNRNALHSIPKILGIDKASFATEKPAGVFRHVIEGTAI
jgi:hypothetical protein